MLNKILLVLEAKNVSKKIINWIKSKRTKPNITIEELKELLDLINDDPNSIRMITQSDFKDLEKISKIIQKRKANVLIKREKTGESLTITENDSHLIDLIANAEGDDSKKEIEERLMHLKISRVSFQGTERWKAIILENASSSTEYISIEDQNLLSKIKRNQLSFSGKEVIEAIVRIETQKGKSSYYLTEYKDIVIEDNIIYMKGE